MKEITGKTKLLGVVGHPVQHSLSPVMHNAALAEMRLDWVYLPFPVKPEDLQAAIAGFAAIELQGFNVTIPHKQAILPYLSDVTAIAQAVGAVNTVWRTKNGWSGTNTDVEGFLAPLKALKQDWTEATAVILGSGGAARATVVGCAQLGFAKIQVIGRDAQKLQDFLQSWDQAAISTKLQVSLWGELSSFLPEANLLVNTTPIGMHPNVNQSPLIETEMAQIRAGTIVYDLIYTPSPTRLLQLAKQQSLVAIDGLEMLVQQGASALKLWLQQPVPIDVMRQSLRQHLELQQLPVE